MKYGVYVLVLHPLNTKKAAPGCDAALEDMESESATGRPFLALASRLGNCYS